MTITISGVVHAVRFISPDSDTPAGELVTGIVDGTPEARLVPTDFDSVLGYDPIVDDDALLRPDGGCSTPGFEGRADFQRACRTHDLGYDTLRYAEATGSRLPWTARFDLDRRLYTDLLETCEDAACVAEASIYYGAVTANSVRQGFKAPREEPGTPWAVLALAVALVGWGFDVTAFRRSSMSGGVDTPFLGQPPSHTFEEPEERNEMRGIRTSSATLALLMVATLSLPASAESSEPAVYLSLGTSLAAGSLADEAGNTTFSSSWSYTDQLHQRLVGRISADLDHVKLGCAGETTDQFVGGTDVFGQFSACRGDYGATKSQLGRALEVMSTGKVELITIDLGANDILHAQQTCQGDPACIAAQIPAIAGKVATIVGAIRASGYQGEILAMNYYNPQLAVAIGHFPGVSGIQTGDPELAMATDQLARGFNAALTQAYNATGTHVVDVYSAFNSRDFEDNHPHNGVSDNVDTVCQLTYMCPSDEEVKANIHANKLGYKVIAKAFVDTWVRAGTN